MNTKTMIEDEFHLASILEDVIHVAKTSMGDKKPELILRIDPNLPKGLLGDGIRIRQIIVNLVENAIRHTPKGAITVKMSQTKHDYGINLSVRVKDYGIGMTQEKLENLFAGYQHTDIRTNISLETMGLNLPASKWIITQMGGFISAASEYGKGSCFKIVIPLKVKNPEPLIFVKTKEPVFAAGYFDLSKFQDNHIEKEYKKLLSEIGDQLHVVLSVYNKFDRLEAKINRGGVTHCFIGREEYLNEKNYFDNLANDIHVVIIQDRQNAISVSPNIKCIYKPFHALTIASLLSTENFKSSPKEHIIKNTQPGETISLEDDGLKNLIDIKTALLYTGGNIQAYMNILSSYLGRGMDKLEQIRDLYQNKEWKNYIVEVHALKSSSLAIGAKNLSELAKELESAGREENYGLLAEKTESMLNLYKEVLLAGQMFLEKNTKKNDAASDTTEINKNKLLCILERIQKAGESFDSDSILDACEEAFRYAYLGKPLKPYFENVKTAIEDFEYEEACRNAALIIQKLEEE